MKGGWTFVLAAASGLACGTARAVENGPAAAVPIELQGTDGAIRVSVYSRGASEPSARPVVECVTPCKALLPPGTYRLAIPETEDTLAGEHDVSVERPSKIWVEPSASGDQEVGLVLGIAGLAAVGVGGVLMSGAGRGCDAMVGGSCSGSFAGLYVGLPLLIAGLVAAPLGFVWYAGSSSPRVTVTPPNVGRRSSGGVAFSPRGLGLSF